MVILPYPPFMLMLPPPQLHVYLALPSLHDDPHGDLASTPYDDLARPLDGPPSEFDEGLRFLTQPLQCCSRPSPLNVDLTAHVLHGDLA